MNLKAVLTGQFNLVKEDDNTNFLSFILQNIFATITTITKHLYNEVAISTSDAPLTLEVGQITDMRGFFIYVSGGSITLKHDSNTTGLQIDSGMILFGKISDIIVTTASIQNVEISYLVF